MALARGYTMARPRLALVKSVTNNRNKIETA